MKSYESYELFTYPHIGMADDVKALVNHIGIATAGVRTPAAATKKDFG